MKAKLGIAPIAWWNDDLADLSDDVSLEECLHQAHAAGFTGMETGRRFPIDYAELGPILARHGISVCGGWFSGQLLEGDLAREKDRIRPQMDLFIAAGAPCIVYGETVRSIQGVRSAPLATKPKLSEEDIKAYGRTMTEFGEWCAGQGMPIAYHHHMAAAIETEAELDLLMKHSGAGLPLLTAGLGLVSGTALIGVATHFTSMSNVAPELALMIGLGVGVDYALFIVTRFRESYARVGEVEAAVIEAMDTSGRAILLAGSTVIIALLGMFATGVQFMYGLSIASIMAVLLV
ncbi:MAG: MMPL family transporter, partial [Acetobacteraceae bacterium]